MMVVSWYIVVCDVFPNSVDAVLQDRSCQC